jgi:nicotinate phosphoribosyltransferase
VFHIASDDDIKQGRVADVYFDRAVEVLRRKGLRKRVVAEVRASSLPADYGWAVLAGIEEVAHLVEGLDASVAAMPEGILFAAGEPVLTIEGEYTQFAVHETALLGLLCQASGVATKAARCRIAAEKRTLISFGARRMHPALSPMIERAAYIGGCDGVAVVKSAELIGINPSGTMPHALVLVVGTAVEAFEMFHEVMPEGVPRICLVDTLCDEKSEAIAAAEALGDALDAVRLDTPSSRRGDMLAILREVRWELDLRGHQRVGLFVSGSLDEDAIPTLNPLADGYGVGTAISNAPVINFALDIVEVEGRPVAKRGKESGRKTLTVCPACGRREILPAAAVTTTSLPCECGNRGDVMLRPLSRDGQIVADLPSPQAIRQRVLDQLVTTRWTL